MFCVFLGIQEKGAWPGMILDIRTIPAGHSDQSQVTDLEAFKADLPPLAKKVSCKAQIDRSNTDLFVHLEFETAIRVECSRCLAPFDFPITGDLRLSVKEQVGKAGPSLDDEAVDFFYDARHLQVDLGPAIYDEIMIALPLKPLCSENCRGIEHGEKSAVGEAFAVKEKGEIDPRWEALKKLKKG
jgi:uncharacterized metal-binding protein YceD (DUF177 family)